MSFIIRALLTTDVSTETNRNVFIAYQIIYNVGFFAILYSAYTLALDRLATRPDAYSPSLTLFFSRETLLETNRASLLFRGPLRLFDKFIHNRFIIRLIILLAVVLGIVGVVRVHLSLSIPPCCFLAILTLIPTDRHDLVRPEQS